jgi:hypothetical protein
VGDGFLSTPLPIDDTIALAGRVQRLRQEHGRGDDPFEFYGRPRAARTPEDFRRLAAGGVDAVGMVPWGPRVDRLDDKLEAIDAFGRDIIQAVRVDDPVEASEEQTG